MSKPWLPHLCHNRSLHWPLQYLVGVPPRSLTRHHETFVGPPIAKAQSRQPLQARLIQHSRRAPCLPAKVQPVQRRSAACFKVRLIPHSAETEDLPAKSKPRSPQARHVDPWEPGFQNRSRPIRLFISQPARTSIGPPWQQHFVPQSPEPDPRRTLSDRRCGNIPAENLAARPQPRSPGRRHSAEAM